MALRDRGFLPIPMGFLQSADGTGTGGSTASGLLTLLHARILLHGGEEAPSVGFFACGTAVERKEGDGGRRCEWGIFFLTVELLIFIPRMWKISAFGYASCGTESI